jgi:hypothetical protein
MAAFVSQVMSGHCKLPSRKTVKNKLKTVGQPDVEVSRCGLNQGGQDQSKCD